MNSFHDPELEDVLQDGELRRIASILSAVRAPEPPLDDAFRTGLRRQLMQEAWSRSEGRDSWWRRAFAPPGIAWAGAAAGLLLIASVVVWYSTQTTGGLSTIYVASPMDGKSNVALQQPILVSFNQPMDHQTTQPPQPLSPLPGTRAAARWRSSRSAGTSRPTLSTRSQSAPARRQRPTSSFRRRRPSRLSRRRRPRPRPRRRLRRARRRRTRSGSGRS